MVNIFAVFVLGQYVPLGVAHAGVFFGSCSKALPYIWVGRVVLRIPIVGLEVYVGNAV